MINIVKHVLFQGKYHRKFNWTPAVPQLQRKEELPIAAPFHLNMVKIAL
jgi:hypothetical protein